ncbi:MAG TPA: DUF2188 domain-containing protein [Burkholderiales bacterium]
MMSTIIAAIFDTITQAEDAAESLRRHGFAAGDVCHFANNPPGQHDQFPIGGDENSDPGAKHAHGGAAAGAGVGAGAGAAIGAVVGGPPGAAVGAGVGAYIGSLAGALGNLEGKGTEKHPVRRPAGAMVAARVDGLTREHTAIRVLRAEGATHIEKAEGRWSAGKWVDFDPVVAPRLIAEVPVDPATIPGNDADTDAVDRVVYRVQRHGDKTWEVQEQGSAAPQPEFALRQDAISHAISLAERHPHSAVEVHGKDGGVIWRETFDRAARRGAASR